MTGQRRCAHELRSHRAADHHGDRRGRADTHRGTSAISDGNGLTSVAFSHQWVRSANGSDNDITDATASTYAVTNADIDKAIKVRVSFTDDDGYSETLTSNATASVPVPAPVIVPPEEPQIAQDKRAMMARPSYSTPGASSPAGSESTTASD